MQERHFLHSGQLRQGQGRINVSGGESPIAEGGQLLYPVIII